GSSSSSSSSASSSASPAAGGAVAAAGATGGGGSTSGDSTAFATLQSIERLNLEVSFSESDIDDLKVGQAAAVTVTALDGVQLSATVKRIGLTASTTSGVVSYPVTLAVKQRADGVRSGMSASAEVVVEQAKGVVVPSQAVRGRSVTVRRDGKDEQVTVQTGVVGDSTTLISSGLSAGDVVVLPTLTVSGGGAAGGIPGGGGAGGAAGGFGSGRGGGGFPGGGAPPGMSGGGFPGGGPG
ncbi:MAG: HlyD family efflux transporter periplasmic adaptor subunit, partial [Patulibacter sp.]